MHAAGGAIGTRDPVPGVRVPFAGADRWERGTEITCFARPPWPTPLLSLSLSFPPSADAEPSKSATMDKSLELMRHFSEQYAQR